MEILVSVIIPVYNVQKYLDRCVQSVLKQKYQSLEIILVDDGSTDESGRICDFLGADHNQVRVIHQKNKGLSGARNAGMDVARGKYLCFLDSDDYLEGDLFSNVIPILERNKLECLGFGGKVLLGDKAEFFGNRRPCIFENGKDYMITNIPISSACLYIFHRKYLVGRGIKFVENILYEDMMFIVDVLLHSPRFAIIMDQYYVYDKREGSITTTLVKDQNYKDMVFIVLTYLNRLKKMDKDPALSNILKTYLLVSEEIFRKLSPDGRRRLKGMRRQMLNEFKNLKFQCSKKLYIECRFIKGIYNFRNIRRIIIKGIS